MVQHKAVEIRACLHAPTRDSTIYCNLLLKKTKKIGYLIVKPSKAVAAFNIYIGLNVQEELYNCVCLCVCGGEVRTT